MKHIILLIMGALLISNSIAQDDKKKDRRSEKMEMMTMWKLTEHLKLTEEQGFDSAKQRCDEVVGPVANLCYNALENGKAGAEAAEKAFVSWSSLPSNNRAQILFNYRSLLKDNLEEIISKNKITFVTRIGPTTFYQNKGVSAGFEYDLMSDFAKYIGVKLNIITITNKGMIIAKILSVLFAKFFIFSS
mgnify:CR=1 FL=1